MSTKNTDARPKFACGNCGSTEVREDFDTYQVYLAEGDKLIHLRSEWTDPAILSLHCNHCQHKIEIYDLGEIVIE